MRLRNVRAPPDSVVPLLRSLEDSAYSTRLACSTPIARVTVRSRMSSVIEYLFSVTSAVELIEIEATHSGEDADKNDIGEENDRVNLGSGKMFEE